MITILSFLGVLGVLIFVHELGHYLAARHVGVTVEAFSIGFPPTAWGKKIGDTEYRLSWVPIGGYVKLFGQNGSDEDPTDSSNYASKSILQRLYILAAGPAMNLIFAMIFMPLVYFIGMETPAYLDEIPMIKSIEPNSFAQKIGIQSNDQVLTINEIEVNSWKNIHEALGLIAPSDEVRISVDRNGSLTELIGNGADMHKAGSIGWHPFLKPIVGGFSPNSEAKKAGIEIGDKIISINGQAINDWSEISPAVQSILKLKDSSSSVLEQDAISVALERKGDTQFINVTPYYHTEIKKWVIGMSMATQTSSLGMIDSINAGLTKLWFLTKATLGFLVKMLAGEGSTDDLGGPVKIGMVIGDAVKSGIVDLFFLMSFISLQLGVFNLLPIPALDGGHIFLLLIEKIKGAPLSIVLRERAQMLGFSVLMGLMVFVTWNDLANLL